MTRDNLKIVVVLSYVASNIMPIHAVAASVYCMNTIRPFCACVHARVSVHS